MWKLGIVLIFVATGCRREEWKGSFASVEALGERVIVALNRGDEKELHALRVTKEEYLGWMWPQFPASRPPIGFPRDFAWNNLDSRSRGALAKALRLYGKNHLRYLTIRFEKPEELYRGFRLKRGSVLEALTPDGKRIALRFLGSVVERNGHYKLLSYQDEKGAKNG